MINYMETTFKGIVKLILANLGILVIWQILYFSLYTIDSENGLFALFELYGILFVAAGIWISMLWFAVSIIPSLIGFLISRKNENKIKLFMGFITGTFVMLGIYVVYWGYFFISMLVDGLNVLIYLIPVVISAVILIQVMIKTYTAYKNISTTAYMESKVYPINYSGNNYQGNQYNYGYNNANYYQGNAPYYNGGEYQTEQQYVNSNNNNFV